MVVNFCRGCIWVLMYCHYRIVQRTELLRCWIEATQQVMCRCLACMSISVIIFWCVHSFLPVRCCISCGGVSVCLSQVAVLSKRLNRQIELIFGIEVALNLSYTLLKGNFGISTTRVVPSGNLSQTLDFRRVHHCTSTVASVVNLGGRQCQGCGVLIFCGTPTPTQGFKKLMTPTPALKNPHTPTPR